MLNHIRYLKNTIIVIAITTKPNVKLKLVIRFHKFINLHNSPNTEYLKLNKITSNK